jgi:hypothetical protein
MVQRKRETVFIPKKFILVLIGHFKSIQLSKLHPFPFPTDAVTLGFL